MFRALALSLCLMAAPLMAVGLGLSSAHAAAPDPAVKLETNYGDIVVRLDARKAPISTANFVQYVKSGSVSYTHLDVYKRQTYSIRSTIMRAPF